MFKLNWATLVNLRNSVFSNSSNLGWSSNHQIYFRMGTNQGYSAKFGSNLLRRHSDDFLLKYPLFPQSAKISKSINLTKKYGIHVPAKFDSYLLSGFRGEDENMKSYQTYTDALRWEKLTMISVQEATINYKCIFYQLDLPLFYITTRAHSNSC